MFKNKQLYSKEHIKKYALNYLNKFGTSKNYLINFLIKKIKSRYIVSDYNTLQKDVEEIVSELANIGFLNDIAFCESRIFSLLKEGNSIFNITIKLKQKNILQSTIDEAFNNILSNLEQNYTLTDLDRYALLKYAKKRNILLWQKPNENLVENNKAINTLLRKGFSFNLVEELVDKNNQIYTNQEFYENYLYNLEKIFNF